MGRIGYARVSMRDQDPVAQELELKAAGAERVFSTTASCHGSLIVLSGWRARTISALATRSWFDRSTAWQGR